MLDATVKRWFGDAAWLPRPHPLREVGDANAGGHDSWVAAAVAAKVAAGYQLATDDPVMAIGGSTGTGP